MNNIGVLMVLSLALLSLAYRFYGRFVARHLGIEPARTTPAHTINDGVDYVPTKPLVLFGHHFASIAAAGPIAPGTSPRRANRVDEAAHLVRVLLAGADLDAAGHIDGVGPHDEQGSAPLRPRLGEEDPKESVPRAELWAPDRARQRGHLLAEREILERNDPVSAADHSDRSEEHDQRRQHD